jgi:hypothetical protein
MWSDSIVVLPPFLDDDLGPSQAVEDFTVEQLISSLSLLLTFSLNASATPLLLLSGSNS